MDPLGDDIGEKRLGVCQDMRKIGHIGRHPVEDFGRGFFALHPNKFNLEHGRLLFALAENPAFRARRSEVNPGSAR
jgi:hypothetical protein